MHGAARRDSSRRARSSLRVIEAARRSRATDRGRSRGAGMVGAGTVRALQARVSLRAVDDRRISRGRRDACHRLQHATRPSRRLFASRCGERCAPWPPRRTLDGDHVWRSDSGHCRLRRRARACGPAGRDGERRLGGREPCRRHLSARQRVVSNPARRSGSRSRRGCARSAADDSVLVGRSPGAERGVVTGGVAASRRFQQSGCVGGRERDRADRDDTGRGGAGGRLSRIRACGVGRAPDAKHDRARAFFRRVRRHAARHSFAVRQSDQSRVGTGAAQALLPQIQF